MGVLGEMFYMKELAQLDPIQKDAQQISATLGVLYSPPLVVFSAPMVLNHKISNKYLFCSDFVWF